MSFVSPPVADVLSAVVVVEPVHRGVDCDCSLDRAQLLRADLLVVIVGRALVVACVVEQPFLQLMHPCVGHLVVGEDQDDDVGDVTALDVGEPEDAHGDLLEVGDIVGGDRTVEVEEERAAPLLVLARGRAEEDGGVVPALRGTSLYGHH